MVIAFFFGKCDNGVMILNNRQTAIIYELLEADAPRSYAYLCEKLMATEKTIRTDISKISDFLNGEDIKIVLKHGKGFYIECSEEAKNNLLANFNYRYSDVYDAISQHDKRDATIIYYLSKGPVKIKDLSERLAINAKGVSELLKQTRRTLGVYNIDLISKPYQGLILQGNEVNIRYYIEDSVSFLVKPTIENMFMDNAKIFNMKYEDILVVANICFNFIKKYKIAISESEMKKLIVLIVISMYRLNNNYHISYSKEHREIIERNVDMSKIMELSKDIERVTNMSLQYDEKLFIAMILLVSVDYTQKDIKLVKIEDSIKEETSKLTEKVCDLLALFNVCNEKNRKDFFNSLYPYILMAKLRSMFSVIETDVNSMAKKTMVNSPVSAALGTLITNYIEKELDCSLGESVRINIAIAMYTLSRKKSTINHKLNIAIYTPLDTDLAISVKKRIQDLYDHIIEKIDILSFHDIYKEDLREYDVLLHFDDYLPFDMNIDIPHFKISYFFNINDNSKFNERVVVPNRLYKNSFAKPKKSDVIDGYNDFNSFDDVIGYVRKLCQNNKNLIDQLDQGKVNSLLICNNILNIVLFTDDDKYKACKFLRLNKPLFYRDIRVNKVFVNIINVKANIINLKTAEKVLRNLSESKMEEEIIFTDKPYDFYDYYILDRKTELK